MEVEIEILNDIPKEQIRQFEEKVIYNCAVFTREFTKGTSAFPYLTGELQRQEIKEPIIGNNLEYGLASGTDYAKYVWNMKKPRWTNPQTQPQWYFNVFQNKSSTIISQAVNTALKEIK